jgi:isoquinoline 1-oxidoreductase alpha subunit
MINIRVNGTSHQLDVEGEMPLLWVLREEIGLTGTKFGCGIAQCGYCQSGQIMATVAYLKTNPNPTDADIDANLTNICRCGTYERLRRAVHRAAALMKI